MELKALSLEDLFKLASQSFSEIVSLEQIIEQKGRRASREDIILLYDSALGFTEVADFTLRRARELKENQATSSPIERDQIDYVLLKIQPVLEASQTLVAALSKRYPYLGGVDPK